MAAGRSMLGAAALVLSLFLGAGQTAGQPGGVSPAAVDDPGVLEAARSVADNYNSRSNQPHLSKVRSVTRASSQVVAGIMYRLTVELGTTVCRKAAAANVDLDQCDFQPNNRWSGRLELGGTASKYGGANLKPS
uniref:cystatin-like n=1 Tax=Pristiophorus japonicus TaxID=55135 RepID=UPI00398F44F4